MEREKRALEDLEGLIMVRPFGNIFKGKRVLVTGHTGFKGSWLSLWLIELGAKVKGYSLDLPSRPANFEVLSLARRMNSVRGDIRNYARLKREFDTFKPEVVFHLAAQAITRRSYELPLKTMSTNILGTANILECIRKSGSVIGAVIITSDKCYQNMEREIGYKETDRLGGLDPYSASKAGAEIVSQSYIKSFLSVSSSAHVATARAGNVIGGGDWASDRIVPDAVRAFSKGKVLSMRNPRATRPWQHVLEPVSAYLWLAANLLRRNKDASGESFNFGPATNVNKTVKELMTEFIKEWPEGKWRVESASDIRKKECFLLQLNCGKARRSLKWKTVLSFSETVGMTADWYRAFYSNKEDMYSYSVRQIEEYADIAGRRGIAWVK